MSDLQAAPKGLANSVRTFIRGDRSADRIVPPTGFTARLTLFASAAMAFLAVFTLALSLATARLAERWGTELAQSSTLRILAPADQMAAQTEAALNVLRTTPGVSGARALTAEEQAALLEPWFGPDLPLDTLPVPQLIEINQTGDGVDAEGLRQRLAGEAPDAILDDHARWRAPMIEAAGSLRLLGLISIALIAATTAAIVTLAARVALAANLPVIKVLRLIGAKDTYIAKAFVRRFTLRALTGATIGTLIGCLAISILPDHNGADSILTGLGFEGWHWLWPGAIPPFAAAVGFWATRKAALRTIRSVT